jgi:hypothetical protein
MKEGRLEGRRAVEWDGMKNGIKGNCGKRRDKKK